MKCSSTRCDPRNCGSDNRLVLRGRAVLLCLKNPAELGAHGPRKTSALRGDFPP
nr:MAG TPA: hypothetical protein [Caudoviricetes sp.]